MGYVPDWNRKWAGKTSGPAKPVRKFVDGGKVSSTYAADETGEYEVARNPEETLRRWDKSAQNRDNWKDGKIYDYKDESSRLEKRKPQRDYKKFVDGGSVDLSRPEYAENSGGAWGPSGARAVAEREADKRLSEYKDADTLNSERGNAVSSPVPEENNRYNGKYSTPGDAAAESNDRYNGKYSTPGDAAAAVKPVKKTPTKAKSVLPPVTPKKVETTSKREVMDTGDDYKRKESLGKNVANSEWEKGSVGEAVSSYLNRVKNEWNAIADRKR